MSRTACIFIIVLISLFVPTAGTLRAGDNTPVVGPRVRVSPPLAGNHSLIDLAIDPDRPADLFACGYRFSALENAMLGFVYRSEDGGRYWREILKDSSSAWVSEESCAAGGGRFFFMAERAFLEHGKFASGLPLQQQGEIHLQSSSNRGDTWDSLVKRGWLDHTAMAVDWTHGLHRGRMYLFGQAARRIPSGYLDEIQLITSDDGKILNGPMSVPMTEGINYFGGYASSARVLPNGTVLAAYLVRRHSSSTTDSNVEPDSYIEVFGTNDGGETIRKRAEFGPIHACNGAMPTMDVNRLNGVVYLAWGRMNQDRCEIAVSSTQDGGASWSLPHVVVEDGRVPSIAVNERGILGLLWLETGDSQCWKFAPSTDDGVTFSNPVGISRCLPSTPVMTLSQSARDASPEVHGQTENSSWNLERTAIGFSVIASKGGLIPDRTGLTTDSTGAFHAVWPEATDQDGALWTASIVVGGTPSTLLPEGSQDISGDVALEFSNAGLEPASGIYAVDVTITNVTSKRLRGQIFLRLDNAYSRYFKRVTPIGNDNQTNLGSARWAVWPAGRVDILNPGETTSPRRLSFLLKDPFCDQVDFGDLLSVRLKAFSVP